MSRTPTPVARFWLTCFVAFVPALILGCQGQGKGPLGSLMANIGDPFRAANPRDVARDLFDVTDADNRRRALAMFAAAPFGDADTYIKWYRLMLGGETQGKPGRGGAPDPDATVRAAAVRALGIHGVVDDVVIIIPRLEDEVAFVRWEAAKALGRIYNPEAIRPLLRSLREDQSLRGEDETAASGRGEPDPEVRQACAEALGQYANPAVFDGLIAALRDTNYGVNYAARRSLKTLTGFDMGYDYRDWLTWAERHKDDLFADQQVYTWTPYQAPPGFWDKVRFWREPLQAEKRVPTGAAGAADAG